MPEPFSGFRTMVSLWNSHDAAKYAPRVPNFRDNLHHGYKSTNDNNGFNQWFSAGLFENHSQQMGPASILWDI
jgi:hypothetical protein